MRLSIVTPGVVGYRVSLVLGVCSLCLVVFSAGLLFGQMEVGVVGGVPLGKVVDSGSRGGRLGYSQIDARTNGYVAGAVIGLPLPAPMRLQAGFTYRRFSADSFAYGILFETRSRFTGNQWEVPLLLTLPVRLAGRWQAYAGLGPSLRFLQGVRETGEYRRPHMLTAQPQVTPIRTDSPQSFTRRLGVGLAVEAGLRWRVGSLALSPAVRITQWDSERTATTSVGTRYARPQVDLLVTARYVRGPDRQKTFGLAPRFGYAVLAAYTPRSLGRYVPERRGLISADVRAGRVAAGALLEWKTRATYAVESGFLVRGVGHREAYQTGSSMEWSANVWEVPLLLRFAPVRSGSRWTFGLGPAARFISHQEIRTDDVRYASGFGKSSLGLAATAGLRYKAGPLLLRPELRYQWFDNAPYDYYAIRFAQHQF